MITLVDTSVWRHYFNGTLVASDKTRLDSLLDQDDAVAYHLAVFGELLLGGLPPNAEQLIVRLPLIPEISNTDTLAFIRTHKLAQQGVGWVDCTLLASAVHAKARFWARDKHLQDAAIALGVAG